MSQVDVPVALVGNKNDQGADRMVSIEEGRKRSQEIGCVLFHEISVRESVEQVRDSENTVFRYFIFQVISQKTVA